MDITTFLAIVLGWYFVIVGLFAIFRQHQMLQAMSEVVRNHGLQLILAVITLILGLLMVVSHNIWEMKWYVIITIVAWLTLLSGIFRLFFPERAFKVAETFMSHPNKLRFTGVVVFIIGAFILYMVHFVSGVL